MPGWAAKPLREVPLVAKDDPGDPDWYPLQHHWESHDFEGVPRV